MILLDTSALIHIFSSRTNPWSMWFDENSSRVVIGVTDLNLCEVLQGLSSESDAEEIANHLREFELHPTGGMELAMIAAANYRKLRRRGITIRSTIDCLIATYCILHGHSLLHHDRDFDPFEKHLGLKVIHV